MGAAEPVPATVVAGHTPAAAFWAAAAGPYTRLSASTSQGLAGGGDEVAGVEATLRGQVRVVTSH